VKYLDRALGGVLVALSVAAFVLLTVIAVTDTSASSGPPEKGEALAARSTQSVEHDIVQAIIPEGHGAPARPEKAPYAPPHVAAPELAAFVDRNAENRVPADITSRVPRVRDDEDIPAVVSVLLDTEDDDTVRNEAANLLRRSGHSGLTADLLRVLDNPKEGARFRAFCIQHLWMNVEKADPACRAKIGSELREALSDRHIPVRREALLALVRMRDPKGRETAVEWLAAEKTDGLRDAAIRCVRELGLRDHIPTIRKYLRDKNDVVRIAAILTLSQWGDEESRSGIEEAAKSGSFRLRRCAKVALKRLDRAAKPQEAPASDDDSPTVQPETGKHEPAF